MVTKIGFSGAHCYDLIHYVSRILYHADKKVLLCDLSSDRSLEASVPVPDALNVGKADVLDYRGVDFTGCYLYQHDRMYDFIILYFGSTWEALNHAPSLDWFIVANDGDARLEGSLEEIMVQAGKLIAGGHLQEKQDGFAGSLPLYINTGVAARELNAGYSAGIPKENIVVVESDMRDLVHRYYCQKNSVFFFSKISSVYKDLLYKLAWSILGEDVTDKVLRNAFKRAERGK